MQFYPITRWTRSYLEKTGCLKASLRSGRCFERFVAEFQTPGTATKTKERLVAGDYGYMVWTAETPDNIYELATDTFVVREGKIVAQSFTANITSKR
jgi:hypothetical protein